ncbi:MAG: hypothetical protein L6R38_001824 [Xanthoria sp. 2 TBL-2021]|nr:MAG: hypothetical protein L6R38_001824 [Xanthoria sp. 2 TBL-2021]
MNMTRSRKREYLDKKLLRRCIQLNSQNPSENSTLGSDKVRIARYRAVLEANKIQTEGRLKSYVSPSVQERENPGFEQLEKIFDRLNPDGLWFRETCAGFSVPSQYSAKPKIHTRSPHLEIAREGARWMALDENLEAEKMQRIQLRKEPSHLRSLPFGLQQQCLFISTSPHGSAPPLPTPSFEIGA